MAATALSVGVMILSTALVNGFQQAVSEKVFSFWGHIHINRYQPNEGPLSEKTPIMANDTLVRELSAMPQIRQVNEYAIKSAILKTKDEFEQVIFKGVGPGYHWENFAPYLEKGSLLHFPDSGYSNQIIISDYMARLLKLTVNDKLIVYFIEQGNEPFRARKLTVAGIYKTSVEEYDKIFILGDLRLIARVNDWPPGEIGGYEIFLKDYRQMDTVRNYIFYNLLPQAYTAVTIRDIYPNIFDWLNLQDTNSVIVILIMAIVAVINMITAILILILERTNMIGILKSLGMPDWPIQKVFIYQASNIVAFGILAGNIFGLGLAFLQKTTGFFKLPEETYYVSVAPIDIRWWEVAAIDIGTLVICFTVLMIPSFLVRAITPIRAIRFK